MSNRRAIRTDQINKSPLNLLNKQYRATTYGAKDEEELKDMGTFISSNWHINPTLRWINENHTFLSNVKVAGYDNAHSFRQHLWDMLNTYEQSQEYQYFYQMVQESYLDFIFEAWLSPSARGELFNKAIAIKDAFANGFAQEKISEMIDEYKDNIVIPLLNGSINPAVEGMGRFFCNFGGHSQHYTFNGVHEIKHLRQRLLSYQPNNEFLVAGLDSVKEQYFEYLINNNPLLYLRITQWAILFNLNPKIKIIANVTTSRHQSNTAFYDCEEKNEIANANYNKVFYTPITHFVLNENGDNMVSILKAYQGVKAFQESIVKTMEDVKAAVAVAEKDYNNNAELTADSIKNNFHDVLNAANVDDYDEVIQWVSWAITDTHGYGAAWNFTFEYHDFERNMDYHMVSNRKHPYATIIDLDLITWLTDAHRSQIGNAHRLSLQTLRENHNYALSHLAQQMSNLVVAFDASIVVKNDTFRKIMQ
jgi:hypothetical protein